LQYQKAIIMDNLKNQRVVILGGTSGLGLATAQAAAAEGAEIIIVSSNQERVNKTLATLPANSKGYTADLTKEEDIKNIFEKIGALDHLVFTAGDSLQLNMLEDVQIEEARKYFNVRYWGAFTAIKYAAPHISKKGSIVLTSGVVATRPVKGWSLGSSICAAMEGLTRAMAIELAPVRVNIVSPGIIKTNLWSGMSEEDREGMYKHLSETLPVQKVGEAADIAQTFLYLMKQSFGTGQTLIVDGGAVLV
jgi:NAD(P)-dependent dehydrogenase (short-subunit alcohol dehydrogenase family)